MHGHGADLLFSPAARVFLTLNNGLLAVDKLVVPEIDLFSWRLLVALLAMLVLLFGLIWDLQ